MDIEQNIRKDVVENFKCKVLIVGGGAGGCSIAWRLSKILNGREIIVLEPSEVHYNQPMFSLVAAGIKQFNHCQKSLKSILPQDVVLIKDRAAKFDPCNNLVHTLQGDKICYDFMVVAVGLKNDYDKIPGLLNALNNPYSCVTTSYSPKYCEKTWCCIQKFQGGHALFTSPGQVGKCSGAALKIMLLADDFWRMQKLRSFTNITFLTGGNVLFGVEKYSIALDKVTANRDIAVNCCLELIELTSRGANFINANGQIITIPYNFLHVTPPMSPPTCLTKCKELVTEAGFLNVDKYTLQHRGYPNVFGIGDCTSTPNSKTAAAVGRQSYVVERNIISSIEGKGPLIKYEGYGACPIMTSYKKAILAESVYDKKPWKSFPIDQCKEQKLLGFLTKNYFPYLYWSKLIKGQWNGPLKIRKFIKTLK